MSTLFRGEEMTLCQIYFQAEAAFTCIAHLGELGIVQFKDVSILKIHSFFSKKLIFFRNKIA